MVLAKNPMISARSLASNFSIQLLGKALSVLIGLIVIAIMTRTLGTESFGEYTTAVTYLQMFGVVVDFGLTLTLIVMISEKGVDANRVVGNFFGLRLVSGFLLFSLAPLSVLALPYSSTVQSAVLVGALAYFFMGGATMLVGIFQRFESMWRAALAELINRAVLLILVVIAGIYSPGVIEMVAAMVASNFLWLLLMIHYAKPFVKIRPLFEMKLWLQILSRSWPIALSIIFNLLYLKGDILFLAYFREQTEVGLYGVAYRIIDVMTVLPVMFMGLVLPSLVAAWSNGRKEDFRRYVAWTFDLFMLAVIPVIVGAQLVSTDLTVLIAGNEFATSGPVLALLTLALLGVFLGALYGHLVVALNKQKVMTLGYIAVAVVAIAGYLWLIPDYGMWGAVWVTLVSEALIAALTFMVVYKTSRALPNLLVTIKALVAAGIMSLALRIVPEVHVVVTILVGALVYTTILIALKAIKLEEIKSMLAKPTV
jgi:O-antigen/teichoic acid export membrane protein